MTIEHGGTASNLPVDELMFLARSRHRIQVLTQLSHEGQSRRDLSDTSDISQPTLGRILGDFERREWVSNNYDGQYALTPLGSLVSDATVELLEVLETVSQLAELAEHLPSARLDFDLRHLGDATVITPSPTAPLAHMRRFDELTDNASTVKMFSNVLSCAPKHGSSEDDREMLANVDEMIVTSDSLSADLDDSELRTWLYGRIENGSLSLHRYEGSASLLFGIFDERVGIVPIDDTQMPCGLIESAAAPIRAWAEETFETYRRAATPLTPEALEA